MKIIRQKYIKLLFVSLSISFIMMLTCKLYPEVFPNVFLEILHAPGLIIEGWLYISLGFITEDPYSLTEGISTIISFLVFVVSFYFIGLFCFALKWTWLKVSSNN